MALAVPRSTDTHPVRVTGEIWFNPSGSKYSSRGWYIESVPGQLLSPQPCISFNQAERMLYWYNHG